MATTRRRPAWHTGHWPMSTPVQRNIRAATGFVVSSAERLGRRRSLPWQRGEELSGGSSVSQECQAAREAERSPGEAPPPPGHPERGRGTSPSSANCV